MAKLFLYYSHTGNGDLVAEELKKQGYDIRKVEKKHPLPKSFFWSVFIGGFLSGINHKDKLKDFDTSLQGYDEIVIGSPIWNAKFSSPINTVLSTVSFEGKKVSFILYAGSGEGPKAIERIQKEFPQSEFVVLKEPNKNPEELKKIIK